MNTKNTVISCAIIASIAGAANAAITVDWYTAAAPNVFGAPSYAQFAADAMDSILNMGGVDNGLFVNTSEVTGMQTLVTTFQSLNGVFAANEYGTRPSWAYYITDTNVDAANGVFMDNNMLLSGTRNYSDTWGGSSATITGDIPFGALGGPRIGVRADGSTSTDMSGDYVGFFAISGMAWTATNWTGTLGAGHTWTTAIDASDPDRFDKLDQLAAYYETYQDSFGFSINFGGQDFFAPNINIIPAPSAVALLGLGGLVATRRRR